jgi:hypothetical protein
MAWSVGGWLLTSSLQGIGAEAVGRLRARVTAELTTTFASTCAREVPLAGMLRRCVQRLRQAATGEKVLVTPQALRNCKMASASALDVDAGTAARWGQVESVV